MRRRTYYKKRKRSYGRKRKKRGKKLGRNVLVSRAGYRL